MKPVNKNFTEDIPPVVSDIKILLSKSPLLGLTVVSFWVSDPDTISYFLEAYPEDPSVYGIVDFEDPPGLYVFDGKIKLANIMMNHGKIWAALPDLNGFWTPYNPSDHYAYFFGTLALNHIYGEN